MAKYDEDLHNNHFFCTFRDKYSGYFDLVAANRYMACIPRADVAVRMKTTQTDIENHILIKEQPSFNDDTSDSSGGDSSHQLEELHNGGTKFTSLNTKSAVIEGEYIYTKSGFKEQKQVKILFSEEFYNSNDQSYQVLCIEQPLEGGYDDANFSLTVSLETVDDCSAFLWVDSASERVKKTIDNICTSVRITSTELHPKAIHDKASGIYRTALDEAGSKLHHWKRTASFSAKSFFQLAIESYVLDKLHPQVFKSLCRVDLGDKEMNKITRKFSEASYADLGIKEEFRDNIAYASKFLVLLNAAKCPLEKLSCFKKTMTGLIKGPGHGAQQTNGRTASEYKSATGSLAIGEHDFLPPGTVVSADDILPMLVYLVLKAEIPNWRCNLLYIKDFHFSQVGNEELQYYLTSFEAAVQYITSGDLQKNLSAGFNQPKLPDTTGMDEIEQANVIVLERLLKSVIKGDLQSVMKVVTEIKKLPDEISQQLCHPLCECETCSTIAINYNSHPSRVSLFSKDLHLRNSLHYSVISGNHSILEWLIENSELKDDVNEEDINKQTLLHLAALQGNQRCLLYLLYKGATLNKIDKFGNTPLHLACSHGHVECVKGLVFHTKKCNLAVTNAHGDTPLHLAARWEYASIASSLLELGANPSVKNNIHETPLTATYDLRVFHHIKSFMNDPESSIVKPPIRPEDSITSLVSSVKPRQYSSTGEVEDMGGARSTQRAKRRSSAMDLKTETDKQLKRLFRAISDNDIAMVKYLLGWKDTEKRLPDLIEEPDGGVSELCHPLCQCEKCIQLRKGSPVPLVTVNSCDSRGNTPLHKASLHGRRQIVQSLLSHGAATNAINKDEHLTPLHLACQYNQKDIVMILLENHVQFDTRDKRGNTPLHFCCNNGHMDSATLLLIHGADLTVANNRGDTPLHNAARWNHASLVRELLLYGAMYSVTNKDNKTAMDLTTDDEVYDVIQQAMKGEIPTGEYACHKHARDPGISDDEEFEHL